MGLQVWLPLNGNLNNQGLSNVTVTNNGATVDNNGKIGKCYSFGTGTSYITVDPTSLKTATEFSFCCWVNIISWNTDYATIFAVKNGTGVSWANLIFALLRNGSNSELCFCISNGSSATNANCKTGTLTTGTWYHITCTYISGTIKLYVNGEVVNTYSTSIVPAFSSIANLWIGRANSGSYQSNVKLNDVRIYNHALSAQEIKLISRGLVLQYPLDRNNLSPYTGNLLLNGFGELGTTNWTTAARVYTDDLPTANTAIKARFTDNLSSEFIPIYRNHKYKFSTYVKSSNTSGNSYPSLYPYDIDKNFIATYNTKEGFNLSTLTTLKQQLKSGDTKIYVNDLSAWNANSGHYYNYAAIFGYKDSTGYTYPTGVYTRITPAFGSGTSAKTNLDKTNNVITLNSAYSGATIPAGTQVCASTAGSTYFYPVGGITNTSIADWTYKEGTFSSEHNRLVAAAYVKVYAYTTCTQAGIKLEDITTTNSSSNTTIYDTSGNRHNGIIYNDPVWDLSSPKYKASTHFTATNQYIRVTNLTTTGFSNSYSFSWWGNMDSWSNAMFWGFSDGVRLNGLFKGNLWNTGDSGNNPLYKPGTTTQVTSPSLNTWHHYVMVGNGTNCVVYLDGELWGQAKTYKTITGTTICFNGWDTSTSYTSSDMRISDFRIYATALSAQDIKDLYNGLF